MSASCVARKAFCSGPVRLADLAGRIASRAATVEKVRGERRPANWAKPVWRAKMGEEERIDEREAVVGPARRRRRAVAVVVDGKYIVQGREKKGRVR